MSGKFRKFFTSRQVRSNHLLESHRTQIAHIEFTSRCNLRCVFCFASQPGYKGTDLDEKTITSIVDVLKTRHVGVVSVNGHGETTIYKDWHRYCNKMLAAGIPLHITSNFAKIFSDEEIETLSGFKSIEISCDTADPVLFTKLRRGADLRTLCLNIIKIRTAAAGKNRKLPDISFSCVVSHANVLNLMDYVLFGKTLGVTHFNFCNLTKYPDQEDTLRTTHITAMPGEFVHKAAASLNEVFEFLGRSKIKYHVQQGLLDTVQQGYRPSDPADPHSLPEQGERCDRDTGVGAGEDSDSEVEVIEAKEMGIHEEFEKKKTGETGNTGNTIIEESGPRRYSSKRPEAHTRDCLDPWQFILVQANNNVLPCCWHEPVSSLGQGQSLAEVFNNTQFKELRRRLLGGELPPDCMSCPARGWTTVANLERKVWHYLNPGIYRFLFPKIPPVKPDIPESFGLDYGQGWYDSETSVSIEDPCWRTWRWTARRAVCRLENPKRKALLILRGSVDKTMNKDQKVIVKLNDRLLDTFIPGTSKFFKEYIVTPDMMGNDNKISLIIETDRVFVPSATEPGSSDNRELGIQFYQILFTGNP